MFFESEIRKQVLTETVFKGWKNGKEKIMHILNSVDRKLERYRERCRVKKGDFKKWKISIYLHSGPRFFTSWIKKRGMKENSQRSRGEEINETNVTTSGDNPCTSIRIVPNITRIHLFPRWLWQPCFHVMQFDQKNDVGKNVRETGRCARAKKTSFLSRTFLFILRKFLFCLTQTKSK